MGKTKSRKWQWKTHMFAKTKSDALRLGQRLKDDAEIGEQGVVYRRYVPLRSFGRGSNDLPLTNEWRFFYFQQTRLSYAYYWPGSDFLEAASIPAHALELADEIAGIASRHVNFFALDLAETEQGDWILIELNDGQAAVPSEHDLDEFYGNLRVAVES
jgi:hypothetical protein